MERVENSIWLIGREVGVVTRRIGNDCVKT